MVICNPIGMAPNHIYSILMIFSILIIWGYILIWYGMISYKIGKRASILFGIVIFGHFLLMQCLISLRPGIDGYYDPLGISRAFSEIPIIVILIVEIVTLLLLIVSIREYYNLYKTSVTEETIKQGFDDLPKGICFYVDGGMIPMANKEMIRQAIELTGEYLKNGEVFAERIKKKEVNAINYPFGDGMVFGMEDGRIYHFRFADNEYEGHKVHQIISTDITKDFRLNEKINQENEARNQANIQLRELNDTIQDVIIQREELDAKIRIHDNLGQAGLVSLRYLRDGYSEDEKERILELWKDNLNFLTKKETNKSKDIVDDIIETAKNVGIALDIRGEIPHNGSLKKVLATAMHECLTNTVRHSKGDAMYTVIEYVDDIFVVCITDNGEAPKETIRETGGLANLRMAVEKLDGQMLIDSYPAFKLTVKVPIGEEK